MADSTEDAYVATIEKLVDLCQPTEIVIGAIGNECERALNEHFISKHVWEFLQFTYHPTLAREMLDYMLVNEVVCE